jgi:ribosomal protein L29|tara:strand:+ start:858 stop:1142 length:285 start_codon:yes stop_codon:yes gene_type:complete
MIISDWEHEKNALLLEDLQEQVVNLKEELANLESEVNAEYREKHSLYNSFCKEIEANKQLKAEIHAVRKWFIHEQNLFLRKWEAERIEYNYKYK